MGGNFQNILPHIRRIKKGRFNLSGHPTGSPHRANILDLLTGIQTLNNLQQRAFGHAIDQQVGLGIKDD